MPNRPHPRAVLWCVASAILVSGCGRGASDNNQPRVNPMIDASRPLLPRHTLRTVTRGPWKAEAWQVGTSAPVWYPVGVWFRLTADEKTAAEAPKAVAVLKLVSVGKEEATRSASCELKFRALSAIENRN